MKSTLLGWPLHAGSRRIRYTTITVVWHIKLHSSVDETLGTISASM